MRLCFIICLVTFMQVSAASVAQSISLNKNNATIKETLGDIRKQSGYSILYDPDILSTAKPVTLSLKNVSVDDAMKACLSGQPFSYEINSKTIVITPSLPRAQTAVASIAINGVVTDTKNVPLPGVTVRVKNTQIVTVTNNLGVYQIMVPDANAILVFSFIGLETQEIPVKNLKMVNVVLKEGVAGLNEVVVVAYGSIAKKEITGSVASVNMEDVQKAPITNVLDGIAGRVAGVTVNSSDGQPGSVAGITVRGPNSLTQSNNPLYVVDGFPLEDASINSINPDDIESFNVLKDASATAIYGARGANGVIVITTKKGKTGPPVVSLNGYYGIQKDVNRMKMLDSYNYVKFQLETNPSQNTPLYITADHPSLASYVGAPTINLQNQLFQHGILQNYDFAVRGGSDKTVYSVSGNVTDQKGIIINSGFKRYQGRFALDQGIGKKLKVGLVANYGYSVASGTPIANAGAAPGLGVLNASAGILYSVWGYTPITGSNSVNNQLDQLLIDPQFSNDLRFNPIIDIKNQLRQTISNNLYTNAYVEYKITPKLTLRSTGGVTIGTAESDAFYNSNTYYGRDTIPGRVAVGNGVSGSISNFSSTIWTNENTLTYNTTINNVHQVNVLVGATFQGTTANNRGFATTHIPQDYQALGLNSLNLAPLLWSATGTSYSVIAANSTENTLASFLGRVNYAYKDKYLVTGSFRADGSSKFAPGNRWGYFSSGAVAWRFVTENFMKPLHFLSDGKLRVGYGQTGNNRVGDFAYLPQLGFASATNFSGYTYNNQAGGSGATLASIGNAALRWETTDMTNIGIDLGFLKQRVQLTADWYKKVTRDLLLNANVPATTGVNTAIENVGKMQNTGLEFTLNTQNLVGKFTWSSSINISFNRNKLLALTEGASFLTLSPSISGIGINNTYNAISPYISIVGQPVGQMYGVVFDGLYQYGDFDKLPNGTYRLKPGVPYYGSSASIQPGWAKYKDINGDGIVDTKDYTIIGRGLPIHTGGFSNNFTYKHFDLNVFFQWSYGNNILNANRIVFEGPADTFPNYINLMATEENRWSPTNQNTTIPVGIGTNYAGYNSRVIEDGSYLRLKTVSLGYNFTADMLKRFKVSSIRVYASGQNLYTWTKYSGGDPDVSTRSTVQSPGFDYMAYPSSRTIVFGFNATF